MMGKIIICADQVKLLFHACLQGQAPVITGSGINWYGGPVVNNKNGIVVSAPLPCFCYPFIFCDGATWNPKDSC